LPSFEKEVPLTVIKFVLGEYSAAFMVSGRCPSVVRILRIWVSVLLLVYLMIPDISNRVPFIKWKRQIKQMRLSRSETTVP
jgi:hypothetical protein